MFVLPTHEGAGDHPGRPDALRESSSQVLGRHAAERGYVYYIWKAEALLGAEGKNTMGLGDTERHPDWTGQARERERGRESGEKAEREHEPNGGGLAASLDRVAGWPFKLY